MNPDDSTRYKERSIVIVILAWGLALAAMGIISLAREAPAWIERGSPLFQNLLFSLRDHGTLPSMLLTGAGNILTVLLAIVVLFVAAGSGMRLLRTLGARLDGLLEEFLLGFMAGWAIIALAMFFSGVAGLYYRPVAFVLLLALTLAGASDGARVTVAAAGFLSKNRFSRHGRLEKILLILAASMLALAAMSALAPVWWTDALVYHMGVPDVYSDAGGMVEMKGHFSSYFPAQVEMVYLFSRLLAGDGLAKVMNLLVGVMAVMGVYAAARRIFGAARAPVPAAVLLTTPIFVFTCYVAGVEAWIALATACGIIALHEYFRRRSFSILLLAALAAGQFAASKYTGLFYMLMGGASIAFADLRAREKALGLIFRLFLFFSLALMLASPFYMRNFLWTGNPLHPFFFESRGMNVQDRVMLMDYFYSFGYGEGISKPLVTFLNYFVFAGPAGALYLFLLPLALLFKGGKGGKAEKFLLAAFFVALLGWAAGTLQSRFLVPPMVIGAVALGGAVKRPNLSGITKRIAGGFVILFVLLNLALVFLSYPVNGKGLPGAALGLKTREELLDSRYPEAKGYSWVNRNTPEDSRVLLLYMRSMAHLMERDFLTDVVFEGNTLRKWMACSSDESALEDKFREEGITHLMVRPYRLYFRGGEHQWMRLNRFTAPELQRLEHFLRRRCELAYSSSPSIGLAGKPTSEAPGFGENVLNKKYYDLVQVYALK